MFVSQGALSTAARNRRAWLVTTVAAALVSAQAYAQPQSNFDRYILPVGNHDLRQLEAMASAGITDTLHCTFAQCVDGNCSDFVRIPEEIEAARQMLKAMLADYPKLIDVTQAHQKSLLDQSKKTGEELAKIKDALAVQNFLTDFSKGMMEFANVAEFFTEYNDREEKFRAAVQKLMAGKDNPANWFQSSTRKVLDYYRKSIDLGRRFQKDFDSLPPEQQKKLNALKTISKYEKDAAYVDKAGRALEKALKVAKAAKVAGDVSASAALAKNLFKNPDFLRSVMKPMYNILGEINKKQLEARKLRLDAFERDALAENETLKRLAEDLARLRGRADYVPALVHKLSNWRKLMLECSRVKLRCNAVTSTSDYAPPPGITSGERLKKVNSEFEDVIEKLRNSVERAKYTFRYYNVLAGATSTRFEPAQAAVGDSVSLHYTLPQCFAKHADFAFLALDGRNTPVILGKPAARQGTLQFSVPGKTDRWIIIVDRRDGTQYNFGTTYLTPKVTLNQ